MVSQSGRLKKPLSSPLLSTLEWIRILCSGCFGIVSRSTPRPRPLLSAPPSPFSMLTSTSHVELDLTMGKGNSTPHNTSAATAAKDAKMPPDIKSLAWNEFHVGLGSNDIDDDDEDVALDDAAAAPPSPSPSPSPSSESDGMFHGLFYLGSKILTEVEMQSPLEESKIIATPVRTPRRSNNSSCASSTRELDFGSASQGCLVDSESCSLSSDAIAVVSPFPYPLMSPSCVKASFSCCKSANSVRMHHASSHDHISTVSSFEDTSAKQYKHKSQHLQPDDDTAAPPSSRESNRKLDQILQPSSEPSQEGVQFLQSGTLWKCQARVGSSSSQCRTGNLSLGQVENACAFGYREGGKFSVVSEGLQADMPVGSLPSGSETNFGSRGWQKDDDEGGGRRARSLTDKDFNELRGCIDLGFVFTEDLIPDLCETLPALEVCYAIAHGPVSPVCTLEDSTSVSPGSPPPISPWKIASPGDQPQQVKTRLRHWAQAVACNLRQVR